MPYDIAAIAKRFQIYGDFIKACPYGSGHINDTFMLIYNQGGQQIRYILQRVNHSVFKNPPAVMENMIRVTNHIRKKLEIAGYNDVFQRVLTIVPTWDAVSYYLDPKGNYWRILLFIENARTYDVIDSVEQAYEAARAFGKFQSYLADLAVSSLKETIPDFHNGQKRYKTFSEIFKNDFHNRAISAKAEIDFVNENAAIFDVLPKLVQQSRIPIRVTHNDTKINNVMIDDRTDEGVCVIDLDTVMPGLSLYDFGDIVRTTISCSEEDEQDLSKVKVDLPRFKSIVKGYLDGTDGLLNEVEMEHMVHAGKLITMIIGMRFLTDYLDGDNYYKTHRNGHNLDRCRTQFKLVASMIKNEEQLQQIVCDYKK